MFRRYIAAAALLAAIVTGCTDRNIQPGKTMASDFTLQDLSGKKVTLSDFRGKVVLIDFWATWCPPCREAIPGVEKLYKAYQDKGLVVLGVSLDGGGWDAVQSFVTQAGITYPILRGTDDVSDRYQVRTIPMLVVLDKEGRIAKRYIGMGSEEDLEKDIRPIL